MEVFNLPCPRCGAPRGLLRREAHRTWIECPKCSYALKPTSRGRGRSYERLIAEWGMRVCRLCEQLKSRESDFYSHGGRTCKECANDRATDRARRIGRDQLNEYQRRYRGAHREAVNEKQRKYRRANAAKVRRWASAASKRHREKRRLYMYEYYRRDPDKHRARQKERRIQMILRELGMKGGKGK